MKKCNKKLKNLIVDVVLPDLRDRIDEIYEEIANDKNVSDELNDELDTIREMEIEFKEVLKDIEDDTLEDDDCQYLIDEIEEMIKEDG